MAEGLPERLTQLEEAVRRAADALARFRSENAELRREVKRLGDERRQVLGQVDAILKDIAKLDLDGGHPRSEPAPRSHAASEPGHPRSEPAPRSHAASEPGHPRSEPAPGPPLQ